MASNPPPKLFDRALIGVSIVVVLGTFMSILDTTIVNVAINTLGRDFDSSLATIQWVSTGYMLALATVIPLTGWAADRFGTKRLYMISIGLFLAGSALAGAATRGAQEPLGREVWVVAAVVTVGVIMSILDTTIVNVALETITTARRDGISRVIADLSPDERGALYDALAPLHPPSSPSCAS